MLSLDAHPAAGRPEGSGGGVRAQRALIAMERRFHGDRARCLMGIAVALRVTGPDPRRHAVVELAMQRFLLDPEGRIVETGRVRTWREEPDRPLPPAARRLTGLVDADLAGRSFCDAEAVSVLMDADFVVAGNATFSRRFLERRYPAAAGLPWACVVGDVDWRSLGLRGTDVAGLVEELGWRGSSAGTDAEVTALLHALDHDHEGSSVACRLIANARAVSWLVEVHDASKVAETEWHRSGWRRDGSRDMWWRRGRCDPAILDGEIGRHLEGLDGRIEILLATWHERYA